MWRNLRRKQVCCCCLACLLTFSSTPLPLSGSRHHCSNAVSHVNQTHYGGGSIVLFLLSASSFLNFYSTCRNENTPANADSWQTSCEASGFGCWASLLEALKQTQSYKKKKQKSGISAATALKRDLSGLNVTGDKSGKLLSVFHVISRPIRRSRPWWNRDEPTTD